MNKFTYNLTSDEDQVLLDMIQYFDDLGLPDNIDPKAYDSLCRKFFKDILDEIYESADEMKDNLDKV